MIPSGNFCFHLLWMHLCTGINIFSPSPHPFYILSIKCVKVNLYIVHFLLLLKKHGAKFNLTKSLKKTVDKVTVTFNSCKFCLFLSPKMWPSYYTVVTRWVQTSTSYTIWGNVFLSSTTMPWIDISGRHGKMYL